jgi:glutamine amidotransferase
MPGLHVLERSCSESVPDLSNSGVMLKSAQQALTLVASVPLTDEAWQPLAQGEVLAIERGRIAQRLSC